MVEFESYDALGLAELVARGEVSAGELLDAAMARADRYNPTLNWCAVIWHPVWCLLVRPIRRSLA